MARLLGSLGGVEPSWLDLIDILIVAFLIYQLLQFIRGTHAVQMALGALVLVLLYWLSQLLHLETVNWLLRTFMPYLVFGIIVVFQTEIRKVLAQLGKTPLPGVFGSPRTEEVIDEVVLAATTLAAQRTGAIVVIERDMGLRIAELLALGNKIPAVAVMTGEESHDEVRRLKRLADPAQRRPVRSATAPSADAAATDDDQAPSPAGHRSPDGMTASNAGPASQPPGDVARQHE